MRGKVRKGEILRARLVIVGGEGIGQKFTLGDACTIGRSLQCAVVIQDPDVSREHASITRVDGGFLLQDLGSRNGTSVNGERITGSRLVVPGDHLRFGPRAVLRLTAYDPIEDELVHRHRLETLGRLTAGVAHDLNNMLGAVTASVSFLRQLPAGERGNLDGDECIDDIEAATARAAELAAQLLAMARASPARTELDLSKLCDEVARLVRRTFDRSVQIDTNILEGIHIDGDSAQIQQVVMNLLVNARDAILAADTREDPALIALRLVRKRRRGQAVAELTVEDNGCGMDDETQARVFEPFFSTKHNGTSIGMGLSTLAEAVAAHGGRVSVESTVGKGSRFSVEFPERDDAVSKRTMQHTRAFAPHPDVPSTAGARLLLVDDEAVMQRSLRRILRREGFVVDVCDDGEAALARLRRRPSPDLVVLDLDLPGMRGQEVIRQMRETSITIPVVAISGHQNALEDDPATSRQVSAFLPKPFDPHALFSAVRVALGGFGFSEITRQIERDDLER